MSTDSPGETLSESEVIAEAEAALDGIKAMRDEIGKVIFGQEQVVENAIIAILSDPVRAQAMGEAAYLRARELFDARKNAARTFSIYGELIGP